jgi:hypothetical protein
VVVRSKRGRFLAIPTENAPRKGTDGRRISPSTFPEHRFGPLQFVPRPNGPSLLVVDGLRASLSRKTSEQRGFRRASDRAAADRDRADHRRHVPARTAGEAAQTAGRHPGSRALVSTAAGADRTAAEAGLARPIRASGVSSLDLAPSRTLVDLAGPDRRSDSPTI